MSAERPPVSAPSGFLRRNWRSLLGGAAGALGGGLYAHFVGCRTGTCLITSNVWVAAGYFGFVGAFALLPWSTPRERAQGVDEAGRG